MGEDCVSLHLIGNWFNKNVFLFLTYGQFGAGTDSSAMSNCPTLRTEFLTMLTVSGVALMSQEDAFTATSLLFSSDSHVAVPHGYIRWLGGKKESQVVHLSVS